MNGIQGKWRIIENAVYGNIIITLPGELLYVLCSVSYILQMVSYLVVERVR